MHNELKRHLFPLELRYDKRIVPIFLFENIYQLSHSFTILPYLLPERLLNIDNKESEFSRSGLDHRKIEVYLKIPDGNK